MENTIGKEDCVFTVGSNAHRKMLNANPVLGENTCLTVTQKMGVIREFGLAERVYLRLQIVQLCFRSCFS